MDEINHEVLATLAADILNPAHVEEIIAAAREIHEASSGANRPEELQREVAAVDREIARWTDAIAAGADQIPEVVNRLRAADNKRRELLALVEDGRSTGRRPAWREVERRMRDNARTWQARIMGDIASAREAFRELIRAPFRFTPFVTAEGFHAVRFEGAWGAEAVFGNVVTNVASPRGTNDSVFLRPIEGRTRAA